MPFVSSVNGLQEEIARRLNESSISADHGDKYTTYINFAMEDIATHFPKAPWLQSSAVLTLAAATRTWQTSSIGSDIRHVFDVRISAQNSKLQYFDPVAFDQLDPKPEDAGIPTLYTVFNDEITFYPTPDADYGAQVRYFKGVTQVSAASAVPELPRQFLQGVILYGWALGLQEREDFDTSMIIEQKYQVWMDRVKKELKKISKDSKRMLSIREIQTANRYYSNEVSQMFFGN